MLALLAVVIVGASLGSTLDSTGKPARRFSTYGFNWTQTIKSVGAGTQGGGWTGYTPLSGHGPWHVSYGTRPIPSALRKQLWQQQCATLTPPRHASKVGAGLVPPVEARGVPQGPLT